MPGNGHQWEYGLNLEGNMGEGNPTEEVILVVKCHRGVNSALFRN